MKKDQFKKEEKNLCKQAEILMNKHVPNCGICKSSYEESKKFGISTTPMCKTLSGNLKAHIQDCNDCKMAQDKWNIDSVKITPEMREIVGDLAKGKFLSIDPVKLKKAASHIFSELGMTSTEIHNMQKDTEKKVKDAI